MTSILPEVNDATFPHATYGERELGIIEAIMRLGFGAVEGQALVTDLTAPLLVRWASVLVLANDGTIDKSILPSLLAFDPSILDGDDWRGPNGPLIQPEPWPGFYHTSVNGNPYAEAFPQFPGNYDIPVDDGRSAIASNELVWADNNGIMPNSVGGTAWVMTHLRAVPDMVAQTFRFVPLTAQGGPALQNEGSTTLGAGAVLCCASADESNDSPDTAIRSVRLEVHGDSWKLGIYDFDNQMGLGSGFHTLEIEGDSSWNGSAVTEGFFGYPDQLAEQQMSMIRVGERLVVKLPGPYSFTTVPNPWVPVFWGDRVILGIDQPAASYATDQQVRLRNWQARSFGLQSLLAGSADGFTAAIAAEALARTGAINVETTDRMAGDAELAALIDLANNTSSTGVEQEANARIEADAIEVAARIAAVAAEAGTRLATDTALTTAVATEAATRASADTVEATARADADALKLDRAGDTMTGALKVIDGTAALPGLAFSDEAALGLYSPSVGVLGFASGGAERVRIDAAGKVGIGATPTGQLHVQPGAVATIGLIVKGLAGQAVDLQQWQDSAGAVLASMNNSGAFVCGSVTSMGLIQAPYLAFTGNTGPLFTMSATSVVLANRTTASNTALIVRGMAAQTGNLQNWQDSTSTTLASVSSLGVITGFQIIATNAISTVGAITGLSFTTTGTTGQVYTRYVQNAAATGTYLETSTAGAFFYGRTAVANVVLAVRAMAGQTGNLQEWQNSAGTALAGMLAGGYLFTAGYFGPSLSDSSGLLPYITLGATVTVLNRTTASQVPLTVKGMAAQTGDLQQWQDSGGTSLVRINSAGVLSAVALSTTGAVYSGVYADATNLLPYISIGSGSVNVLNRTTASQVPLVVRGMAAQSGDLQQWQNSTPATMARVNAYGNIFSAGFLGPSLQETTGLLPYIALTSTVTVYNRTTASQVPFTVMGMAGQSGHLQRWQDSAFTVLAFVSAAGVFNGVGLNATTYVTTPNVQDVSSASPYIQMGSSVTVLNRNTASNVILTVKGMAAQTGDLQRWVDSAGAIISAMYSTGQLQLPDVGVIFYSGPSVTSQVGGQLNFKSPGGVTQMLVRADQIGFNQPIRSMGQNPAAVPLTVKGEVSQTANLQEWQASNSSILCKIDSGGNATVANLTAQTSILAAVKTGNIQDSAGGAPYVLLTANAFTLINRNTVGNVVLGVRGMAGQTGDLQQWQDSASAVLARITSGGTFIASSFQASTIEHSSGSGTYFDINSTTLYLRGRSNAANVVVGVRGMAAQTGDLQQWQNSASVVLSKVGADGQITAASLAVTGNVGFYATAPIAKQTVAAAATDAATTQSLVNDLRAKLIALGLVA